MAKFSVGDSVAADMHSRLNSQEYVDLFKTASDKSEDSASASDGSVSGSGSAGAHKVKSNEDLYGKKSDALEDGGATDKDFKVGEEGTGKDSHSAKDDEDSCIECLVSM